MEGRKRERQAMGGREVEFRTCSSLLRSLIATIYVACVKIPDAFDIIILCAYLRRRQRSSCHRRRCKVEISPSLATFINSFRPYVARPIVGHTGSCEPQWQWDVLALLLCRTTEEFSAYGDLSKTVWWLRPFAPYKVQRQQINNRFDSI